MQRAEKQPKKPVETSPDLMRLILSLVLLPLSLSLILLGESSVLVVGAAWVGTLLLCWSVLALSTNDNAAVERKRRLGIGLTIVAVPVLSATLGFGTMTGATVFTPGIAGYVLIVVALRSKRKQLSVIQRQ